MSYQMIKTAVQFSEVIPATAGDSASTTSSKHQQLCFFFVQNQHIHIHTPINNKTTDKTHIKTKSILVAKDSYTLPS